MKISAALIVKNEEHCLDRCLASLASAVDEIVVVDTGSEDQTKAVARRYTDRVFDYRWHNDFAAARQYSFEQVTGDWVLWVDADDVVVGAGNIRRSLELAPAGLAGFYWRYLYAFDDWGNPTCEFWRERCLRNDGTFQWQGRVHEVLVPQGKCDIQRSEEVIVHHRPDPSRIPLKLRRNIEILEVEYEGQAQPAPRTLFYLASEYASTGDGRKALEFYKRYLRVSVWDDERYIAQTRIADLYRSLGRYRQAIDADLKALKVCPHWPDAYFGLAETYYYLADWHKVIHWTEVGRAMPRPDTAHIINPMRYAYNWIIYYTNALYHVGEVREALIWTRRALEICPAGPWHCENLLSFERTLQGREDGNGTGADSARLVLLPAWAGREPGEEAADGAQEGVDVLIPTLHEHEDDPRIQFCREVLEATNDTTLLYLKGAGTFAEKVNLGLKQTGRQYVLILNDDAAVPPGVIQRMKSHFVRNPKLGVLGVFSNCDYTWHHHELPLGIGSSPTLEQVADRWEEILAEDESRAAEFAGESVEIPWANFYCVMIPRHVFEEVGRLDPRFKNCAEDVDFCRRVQRAGYEIRYAQDGWVIHFGSASLMQQESAARSRNTDESNRWLSHKETLPSVGFYCPLVWDPWSPKVLSAQGAGGSETAAIQIARLLADIGHQVTVFNQNDGERWYEGVSYVDYGRFNPWDPPQVLIAWRAPELADFGEIGRQRYLWMQDMDVGDRLTPERAEKFSRILVVSEAHKSHLLTRYPFLEEDQLLATRNGLDLTRFEQPAERDPYRLIYSSSPDRGLDVLLTIFPKIREQCPDANLDIFYGWAGFDRVAQVRPDARELRERIMSLLDQPGVKYHGAVDQLRLARAMLGSALWVYPTTFHETSCISAMEAQAGGAVPVTRPLAALKETVRFGLLLDGDVHEPDTQNRYIEEVVFLLQHPEEQERIRAEMIPWARETFGWEEVAQQWHRSFMTNDRTSTDLCDGSVARGGVEEMRVAAL
jgi:GT2 family glycosyltransferase